MEFDRATGSAVTRGQGQPQVQSVLGGQDENRSLAECLLLCQADARSTAVIDPARRPVRA